MQKPTLFSFKNRSSKVLNIGLIVLAALFLIKRSSKGTNSDRPLVNNKPESSATSSIGGSQKWALPLGTQSQNIVRKSIGLYTSRANA